MAAIEDLLFIWLCVIGLLLVLYGSAQAFQSFEASLDFLGTVKSNRYSKNKKRVVMRGIILSSCFIFALLATYLRG